MLKWLKRVFLQNRQAAELPEPSPEEPLYTRSAT